MMYTVVMSDLVDEDGCARLSVRELREQLGHRIDVAHYKGEATVITKNGQPRAALISHEQYCNLTEQAQRAEGTS
jgi:prevent-host-death family protein